ncbi:hypothetical protein [Paenibacillus radicis (ex Xue et al. 2023)]|uniref:Uncharacterized protein n=1 Tax=Paenibacillus radicis (ex Xue et al. 2023) TaxID=2972489 RepID=A0ABT1YBN7_9BACL|nr:hypothetical protein [Paenibacillus radicis (ex Xue et al. 2023)]MCR8630609.1 hypothetical protein [Paenibacillus radicis (ex Xue et al. 2023)]
MTAKIAVSVVEALCRESFPYGVYHVDQLFELKSMYDWLRLEVSMEIRIDGMQINMEAKKNTP